MADNLQKSSITIQMSNHEENEKNVRYNVESTKIVSSDINVTSNHTVVLDYTAGKNENHHIFMENDKYAQNKLINIRETISKNYDEILNSLERFKEELYIKDLRFSQLVDDMCSIRSENEEKSGIIQFLQEKYSEFSNELVDVNINSVLDDSQKSEIHEGKLLIVEQIKQLNGYCDEEIENYRLSDLINMLMMAIFDKEVQLETLNTNSVQSIQEQNLQLIKEVEDHKEWQKHLEFENEKLNSEIEFYKRKQNILLSKENEYNDFKKDYLKIQCMYDELSKENSHLKKLVDKHQNLLTEKETKCDDNDNLIKVLQSNLTEQIGKTEHIKSMYNNEKEKCLRVESHIQQIIEEFTVQIHEKNIKIQSILDEYHTFEDRISSADAEIENLKLNIVALDYAIGEKNKTIQDLVKYKNKQQYRTTSSSQFNDLMQILNRLNQQMDIILGDLCTYKKKINEYENMLYNMQNTFQTQNKIKNYLKTKQKEFSKNLIKEKKIILLKHQKEVDYFKKEMENLKKENNLKIIRLVDTEIKLKDEIQYLKEELKLKSSHIIMTEKIANSQLQEAYNIIQRLTGNPITESLEFNEKDNCKSEMHHHITQISGITNSKCKEIECLIDLMQKLKTEKNVLQKVCQMREEKIKNLERCHCSCSTDRINL